MADITELKKVHLKLAEDGVIKVYHRNQYGVETSITVDAETAKSASISEEGVTWGMFFIPFEEIVLTHPVCVPRVMGEPYLPKDALHLVYELIAEYFMHKITAYVPINFKSINEKYVKCLRGADSRTIYYKILRGK